MCAEIKRKYPNHDAGMFIYGDATSKKADAKLEKGYNLYTLITKSLDVYRPILRLSSANPSVVMRGNFVNSVFSENYGGLEFYIDESCRITIADYENLKQASDGTKFKHLVMNKATGVAYQQYGHTSDANDYLYTQAFATEYANYTRRSNTVEYSLGVKKANYKNSY